MTSGYDHREIMSLGEMSPRPAPPVNVLSVPHREQWTARIWSLVSDFVTEEVKQAVIEANPRYLVSDDLSWLNEPILDLLGQSVDMRTVLAQRLLKSYEAIRAVHGTRVRDLSPFYTNGLVPMDPAVVETQARSLFAPTGIVGLLDRFKTAVTTLDARKPVYGRAGLLYFCANGRDLTDRYCGHYLIYGSEYLYCLGIRMIDSTDVKRILKSVGRPTAIVADIPMSFIDFDTLENLAGGMLESAFNELLGINDEPFSETFSITVQRSIEAKHIVGHYHPKRILDPLSMA